MDLCRSLLPWQLVVPDHSMVGAAPVIPDPPGSKFWTVAGQRVKSLKGSGLLGRHVVPSGLFQSQGKLFQHRTGGNGRACRGARRCVCGAHHWETQGGSGLAPLALQPDWCCLNWGWGALMKHIFCRKRISVRDRQSGCAFAVVHSVGGHKETHAQFNYPSAPPPPPPSVSLMVTYASTAERDVGAAKLRSVRLLRSWVAVGLDVCLHRSANRTTTSKQEEVRRTTGTEVRQCHGDGLANFAMEPTGRSQCSLCC